MIRLTPSAIEQVRKAAAESGSQGLGLRLAAKPDGKGNIDYAMGFDQPSQEDLRFDCAGFEVLVSPLSEEVLDGVVLDFVEITPGESRFIFMNPNDPNYEPPDGVEYAPQKRAR
jgi:iron-sulfur cluster assembly protein